MSCGPGFQHMDMSAAYTLREEEAVSADGWTVTVTLKKTQTTPHGSEQVVGEKTYNYKKTPLGEAAEARESRLRVKRKARQRALTYFDPGQHEQLKQKRRKNKPGQEQAPAVAAVVPLLADQAGGSAPVADAPDAVADADAERSRQRDWALVRAFKAGVTPHATWVTLSQQGLIDAMEWSVQDLVHRHAHVSQCVSLVAQLLGPELSAQKLAALHDVCA